MYWLLTWLREGYDLLLRLVLLLLLALGGLVGLELLVEVLEGRYLRRHAAGDVGGILEAEGVEDLLLDLVEGEVPELRAGQNAGGTSACPGQQQEHADKEGHFRHPARMTASPLSCQPPPLSQPSLSTPSLTADRRPTISRRKLNSHISQIRECFDHYFPFTCTNRSK